MKTIARQFKQKHKSGIIIESLVLGSRAFLERAGADKKILGAGAVKPI